MHQIVSLHIFTYRAHTLMHCLRIRISITINIGIHVCQFTYTEAIYSSVDLVSRSGHPHLASVSKSHHQVNVNSSWMQAKPFVIDVSTVMALFLFTCIENKHRSMKVHKIQI